MCKGTYKYLEVQYRCIQREQSSDPCKNSPCGIGAICKNVKGLPDCSCPAGKTGDPNEKCCKPMKCG